MRPGILVLFDPASDAATLSGGGWQMPLANLQNPDQGLLTRSTNLDPANTQLRIAFGTATEIRAVVLKLANATTAYRYRARCFADAGYSEELHNSGWVQPGAPMGDPFELPWEHPNWWTGLPAPVDPERGTWLVHPVPDLAFGAYWLIELEDPANPDGFLDLGRLFMAAGWAPSFNYDYGGAFTFRNNAQAQQTLSGGKIMRRRLNPKVLRVGFTNLPEAEGFDDAYEFFRFAGFDREVFVIPEWTDTAAMQARAFMGRISQMDPLTQAAFLRIGTGFEIEEII